MLESAKGHSLSILRSLHLLAGFDVVCRKVIILPGHRTVVSRIIVAYRIDFKARWFFL